MVLPAKNRKAMSKNSIARLISEAEGFGAGLRLKSANSRRARRPSRFVPGSAVPAMTTRFSGSLPKPKRKLVIDRSRVPALKRRNHCSAVT